jgi:hypothetical protein
MGVAAVQVDKCGAATAVAHTIHQFAERSSGASGQGISRVPQVVKSMPPSPAQLQDKGIPSSARRIQISLLADAPERPSAGDWQSTAAGHRGCASRER